MQTCLTKYAKHWSPAIPNTINNPVNQQDAFTQSLPKTILRNKDIFILRYTRTEKIQPQVYEQLDTHARKKKQ